MEKGPVCTSEYTFRTAGLLVSFRRLLVGHIGGHLVSFIALLLVSAASAAALFLLFCSFLTYTGPTVEAHACLVVD